jgi:hypothetical protein
MGVMPVTKLSFAIVIAGQIDYRIQVAGGQTTDGGISNYEVAQFLAYVWKNGWKLTFVVSQQFPGGYFQTD